MTDLYDPREQWASYIINAIKAKELFLRDVSYIVRGGEIVIVDEFTGRTMPGRRWSDGLHQAVEAKEGVEIQKESVTLASISYQARAGNMRGRVGGVCEVGCLCVWLGKGPRADGVFFWRWRGVQGSRIPSSKCLLGFRTVPCTCLA